MKVHLLRFPTSCSARRSPRIPESPFSRKKGSAPGSEAAWDKWLLQNKSQILRKKFCPRQRSCPGQVACSKKSFWEKKFCPRQRSCPGQVTSSKQTSEFREKVLPQAAKLPGTSGVFKKSLQFEKKFCLRQRSCPGQVDSSKKKSFF